MITRLATTRVMVFVSFWTSSNTLPFVGCRGEAPARYKKIIYKKSANYIFNTFMPFTVNRFVFTMKESKDMKISKGW